VGRKAVPMVTCSFVSLSGKLSTMGRNRVVSVGVTRTKAAAMAHSTTVTLAAAMTATIAIATTGSAGTPTSGASTPPPPPPPWAHAGLETVNPIVIQKRVTRIFFMTGEK
jgi:hypothetical protein